MNITEPIRRFARINPAAVALVRADRTAVTYRGLDRLIDAAAAVLRGLGVEPGQTVGLTIAGPDESQGLIVALALAQLGAVSADARLPAEHFVLFIAEGGGAAAPGVRSVAMAELWGRMPPSAEIVPTVAAHRDGAAACRIFASSGTTGVPKFAAVSHDLMAARVLAYGLAMGGHAAVRVCAVGFGITWGFGTALRTLWSGGTLVLSNPAEAARAIQRHRVTSLVIAPMSLQKVVASLPATAKPLPALAIEVGGSAMPAALAAATRARLSPHIVAYFGATETGGVAAAPLAALAGHPRAVGYVYAGIEVEAVDEQDRTLPPDNEGVLRIRGATVVSGYLGAPALSAEIFRDGWFYPGDVGAISADGMMSVTGRRGEFINAGGNKLSPQVVEDVLLSLPQVTDAAAFGVPDKLGVVQIWAAIVATTRVENAVLTRLCGERLGEKSPKFIMQLKGLPRNANGKVLREELVKFALTQQR